MSAMRRRPARPGHARHIQLCAWFTCKPRREEKPANPFVAIAGYLDIETAVEDFISFVEGDVEVDRLIGFERIDEHQTDVVAASDDCAKLCPFGFTEGNRTDHQMSARRSSSRHRPRQSRDSLCAGYLDLSVEGGRERRANRPFYQLRPIFLLPHLPLGQRKVARLPRL